LAFKENYDKKHIKAKCGATLPPKIGGRKRPHSSDSAKAPAVMLSVTYIK